LAPCKEQQYGLRKGGKLNEFKVAMKEQLKKIIFTPLQGQSRFVDSH